MKHVRVLVVDDDDLMRVGLKSILSTDEWIDTVGEAATGAEAVAAVRRLRPHVVLMDVRMPGVDGIEATRAVVGELPATKVLMLTTFEDDDYVFGALEAGASGFLLKRTPPEQLIAAVHAVATGDAMLSPAVARKVIGAVASRPRFEPSAIRRLRELTPREREVMELAARGLTNAEIAASFVIEESTVKSHLKRIFSKLDVRDRVELVILGYEAGIVRPGERDGPER